MIDYYLKDTLSTKPEDAKEHKTPVKIGIATQDGKRVATFYGPAKKAFNRLVWNLHYQSPTPLKFDNREANEANPFTTNGPPVVPGTYEIAVTVDGKTDSTEVEVLPDPRFKTPANYFTSNTSAGLLSRNEMSALNEVLNRIQNIEGQISTIRKSLGMDDVGMKSDKYKTVLAQLDSLDKKFSSLKDTAYDKSIQHEVGEDDIHDFSDFHSQLGGTMYAFRSPYSGVPSEVVKDYASLMEQRLNSYLEQFDSLLNTDVPAFNRLAQENSVPIIFGGPNIEIGN